VSRDGKERGDYKVGLGAFRMRCSFMVFPLYSRNSAGWPNYVRI
jgi:hypothetical protein